MVGQGGGDADEQGFTEWVAGRQPVLQRRFRTGRLVEWRDGEVVRRVDDGAIAWGGRMVAGDGMVALTGGLGGGAFSGPVVIDTTTGERVAYAPVRDRSSEYGDNGFLTAQGFLDEDTLLLLVGPIDFRTMDIGEERWTSSPGTSGPAPSSSSRPATPGCVPSRSPRACCP